MGTSAAARPIGPNGRSLALALTALLLLGSVSESALARGGRRGGHAGAHHSGGHAGAHHSSGSRAVVRVIAVAPAFWYLPAPIIVPRVVVAPTTPPIYIEQGSTQPAPIPSAAQWWYYCADSKAYYPYVKECALEWQPVAAEPRTNQ